MSDIRLVTGDMTGAAESVRTAGGIARSADGSDHISGAAEAVPGSSAEGLLTGMAGEWETSVSDWHDAAQGFADAVSDTSADMSGTDGGLGGVLGGWGSLLGIGG